MGKKVIYTPATRLTTVKKNSHLLHIKTSKKPIIADMTTELVVSRSGALASVLVVHQASHCTFLHTCRRDSYLK